MVPQLPIVSSYDLQSSLFLIRLAGNCGHLCFIYLVLRCFLHELFSAEKINFVEDGICELQNFLLSGGLAFCSLYLGLE